LKAWLAAAALHVLAPIVSGFLLVLAYPTFNWWGTAWFAFVPLLLVLNVKGPGTGFLSAHICGMSFFTGIYYWILEVPAIQGFHLVILVLFLGIYFGLFGLVFTFIRKRIGTSGALLTAPFVWVGIEYIRSSMGFLAHPWPLLGHSQIACVPVVQVAALTGVYGVSFLLMLINATLTAGILAACPHFYSETKRPSRRTFIGMAVTATLLVGLASIYGLHVVNRPAAGSDVKIAVVQANIAQAKKWDRRYAPQIVQTYIDLTHKAAMEHPSLIVWPEAATPHAINVDRRLYMQIKRLAQTIGIPIVLGSTHHQKFKTKSAGKLKFTNSAFLIRAEGKEKDQRYDKIRLLPFGEYLPKEDIIPWAAIHIPNIGSYLHGKEFTVFHTDNLRFAVTICWETAFPYIVRTFVKNGAQFIVNITNEAWFGKTTAPYQFVAMNAFRAVENRIPMVRCTNTGISCFIDPFGRVIDRITDADGRDIFISGTLARSIKPTHSKTIYTRYGDWFAWLCLILFAIALAVAFLRNTMTPSSNSDR
jgi:apolipoprotein N-acyltransferase